MKEQIMEPFKKANRIVEKIYNFSINYYLIYAPMKGVKDDKDGSYFLMDKKTKYFRAFSPFEDFDRFDNAIHNGEIKIKKEN